MDTPRTDRVRTVRLPRTVPLIEPISSVEAGFFSSARFFMRIGIFGVVASPCSRSSGCRLWSLPGAPGAALRPARDASRPSATSTCRPAGPIVDAHGRPLAGVTGELVVTADPSGARQGERARRLAAELGGQPDPRPARARRAAVGPRAGARAAAREAHPPRARAFAVRAGGRAAAPDDAGLALPRRARTRLPRPSRRLAARSARIPRARSAASSSACSARSARRS